MTIGNLVKFKHPKTGGPVVATINEIDGKWLIVEGAMGGNLYKIKQHLVEELSW